MQLGLPGVICPYENGAISPVVEPHRDTSYGMEFVGRAGPTPTRYIVRPYQRFKSLPLPEGDDAEDAVQSASADELHTIASVPLAFLFQRGQSYLRVLRGFSPTAARDPVSDEHFYRSEAVGKPTLPADNDTTSPTLNVTVAANATTMNNNTAVTPAPVLSAVANISHTAVNDNGNPVIFIAPLRGTIIARPKGSMSYPGVGYHGGVPAFADSPYMPGEAPPDPRDATISLKDMEACLAGNVSRCPPTFDQHVAAPESTTSLNLTVSMPAVQQAYTWVKGWKAYIFGPPLVGIPADFNTSWFCHPSEATRRSSDDGAICLWRDKMADSIITKPATEQTTLLAASTNTSFAVCVRSEEGKDEAVCPLQDPSHGMHLPMWTATWPSWLQGRALRFTPPSMPTTLGNLPSSPVIIFPTDSTSETHYASDIVTFRVESALRSVATTPSFIYVGDLLPRGDLLRDPAINPGRAGTSMEPVQVSAAEGNRTSHHLRGAYLLEGAPIPDSCARKLLWLPMRSLLSFTIRYISERSSHYIRLMMARGARSSGVGVGNSDSDAESEEEDELKEGLDAWARSTSTHPAIDFAGLLPLPLLSVTPSSPTLPSPVPASTTTLAAAIAKLPTSPDVPQCPVGRGFPHNVIDAATAMSTCAVSDSTRATTEAIPQAGSATGVAGAATDTCPYHASVDTRTSVSSAYKTPPTHPFIRVLKPAHPTSAAHVASAPTTTTASTTTSTIPTTTTINTTATTATTAIPSASTTTTITSSSSTTTTTITSTRRGVWGAPLSAPQAVQRLPTSRSHVVAEHTPSKTLTALRAAGYDRAGLLEAARRLKRALSRYRWCKKDGRLRPILCSIVISDQLRWVPPSVLPQSAVGFILKGGSLWGI